MRRFSHSLQKRAVRSVRSWQAESSIHQACRSMASSPTEPFNFNTSRFHPQHFTSSMAEPCSLLWRAQRRSLSTSDTNVPAKFNPHNYSSTRLLEQKHDSELSPEEVELKQLLAALDADDDDYVGILQDLSAVYHSLGYWNEALQVERIQSAHYLKADAHADSVHAQGKLTLRLGQIQSARRLYQQCLEHYSSEEYRNEMQQGHVQMSLAGCYYFQDDLERALELLVESEPKLGMNPTLLMKNLDNQGLVYRDMEDYPKALECYQQALQVIGGDSLDDTSQIQSLRLHIADMTSALGNAAQAIELYGSLFESTDDVGLQGVLLHNMAELHVREGETELALGEYQLAIRCKRQANLIDSNVTTVPDIATTATTGATSDELSTSEMISTASPELIKTMISYGALQARLEHIQEALGTWQEALFLARVVAGEDASTDPQVLNLMQSIEALQQDTKNNSS